MTTRPLNFRDTLLNYRGGSGELGAERAGEQGLDGDLDRGASVEDAIDAAGDRHLDAEGLGQRHRGAGGEHATTMDKRVRPRHVNILSRVDTDGQRWTDDRHHNGTDTH